MTTLTRTFTDLKSAARSLRRNASLSAIMLATLASRGMSSLLFGAPGADPWTVAVAGASIVALVFVCSIVPVSRALRVDPIVALREE